MLVFYLGTVVAQSGYTLRQLRVVGDDGPGIAERAEIFPG